MAAQTPEDVHLRFAEYFSAGNLDSLLSLYEPGATLVVRPGAVVSGHAAIREALARFLALKGRHLEVRRTLQAGDLALLLSRWTVKGTDPTAGAVETSGQTSDVVRRQLDGSWLLVIDNPNGAESAE